jgi:rRNA processing protein Krr1/Pno1
MRKIICEKIIRIIKSKENLERELNVILDINGNEVHISGKSEEEYIAERVIEALDFGFPFSAALEIKKENIMFEILNIKEFTPQKNF